MECVKQRKKIETQTEFPQMKTIFEVKNTLEGTINTLDIEEKTRKSEDIMIETMHIEKQEKQPKILFFLYSFFNFKYF